jgi:hypothetical protein
MRTLNSKKNLVAFVLAAATGMTLYFRMPFPEGCHNSTHRDQFSPRKRTPVG